jgi:2-dehydropantoate 2-reductase
MLASRLGDECVLGGLSNLGATMVRPGIYEQRNAGEANGCACGSFVQ